MSSQLVASGKPKIRAVAKGSVVSLTYEFPYMHQPAKKTLRQLIYDGEKGKILGRTCQNWGKEQIITDDASDIPMKVSIHNHHNFHVVPD